MTPRKTIKLVAFLYSGTKAWVHSISHSLPGTSFQRKIWVCTRQAGNEGMTRINPPLWFPLRTPGFIPLHIPHLSHQQDNSPLDPFGVGAFNLESLSTEPTRSINFRGGSLAAKKIKKGHHLLWWLLWVFPNQTKGVPSKQDTPRRPHLWAQIWLKLSKS